MRRSHVTLRLAAVLALLMAVSACAGAASPAPTATQTTTAGAPSDAASPPASDGPSAEPSASERVGPPEGQASEFTVAETAVGIGSLSFRAAIDQLRDEGYTINTPELAESELVTQGTASGEFQFGSGANNSALLAMEAGAPIKFIVDRNANEWTIVTTAEIDNCEELVDSRVAIHSPGSVSGAMIRDWIEQNCPGNEFDPIIIAGSQNRAAALQAGQIDATPAELRDWIVLREEGGDAYKLLVNFAQDLPQLHPTSMYGNTEWMEQNPDVVEDLIREILLQNRRINSEEGYLLELYREYLPEEASSPTAEVVADTYVELGLFPVDGGLTPEVIEYTAEFFGPNGTGDLQSEMSADEISDFTYLNNVLDRIGREE